MKLLFQKVGFIHLCSAWRARIGEILEGWKIGTFDWVVTFLDFSKMYESDRS
jgi:hypothetical protein